MRIRLNVVDPLERLRFPFGEQFPAGAGRLIEIDKIAAAADNTATFIDRNSAHAPPLRNQCFDVSIWISTIDSSVSHIAEAQAILIINPRALDQAESARQGLERCHNISFED